MKKLKIGELSDLVGLPASALRFWEERGIGSPEKDSDNSYRLYSAEDSCRFLLARRYRSFDIPLADARAMLVDADPDAIGRLLDGRAARMDEELGLLAAKRDELRRYRAECLEARRSLSSFAPATLPAARYIFTIDAGRVVDDQAALELAKRWTGLLPFSSFALYVPPEAFSGAPDFKVRWGFGLEDGLLGAAGALGEAKDYVLRLPESACVRTAFYRDDPRDMKAHELAGVAAGFRASGYEAAGPAIGRLLEMHGSGGAYRYLYSLYIPIK